jgi:hypothetical protein
VLQALATEVDFGGHERTQAGWTQDPWPDATGHPSLPSPWDGRAVPGLTRAYPGRCSTARRSRASITDMGMDLPKYLMPFSRRRWSRRGADFADFERRQDAAVIHPPYLPADIPSPSLSSFPALTP